MYELIIRILNEHCTTTHNKFNGGEEIQSSKDAVIEAMKQYGEEVLKIAAEKARLKGERDCEYYEFYRAEDDVIRVNEESILNCLKE